MSPPAKKNELIPASKVQVEAVRRIFTARGQRVVLDSDLAEFYGVETENITRQVSRNPTRFPKDFCFRLTRAEWNLIRQNGGSSSHGGRRKLPLVFAEQGALAISGVLKSERADEVSVAVARAFVIMRDQLAEFDGHPVLVEVAKRLAKLEKNSAQQTEFNRLVINALRDADSFIELIEGQLPEPP